jgi:DNA polymerase I-like protein with 3'-5' exonuclease and polymerase domains
MSRPEFSHFIVNSFGLFQSLVKYSEAVDSDIVCYDLETNSEIEKIAKVWGIGICFTDKKAFYIPWKTKTGDDVWSVEQQTIIVAWLKKVLTSRKLIGHNIIFDVLVTENNFGFQLDDAIHADTILMKHTLDEEPPFGLKDIAPVLLGNWATLAQEKLSENVKASGGKWTEDQKDMYLADTDILGEYCCWDVLLTLLLYKQFDAQLEKEDLKKLFYDEEIMPLYKEVTINMKRKGFKIDLEHFKTLKSELEFEINRLETEIYKDINHVIEPFEAQVLEKDYPLQGTLFPKTYAEIAGIPLPVNKKTGKITLAAKAVELQKQQCPQFSELYDHILGTEPRLPLDPTLIEKTQKHLFFRDHPDKTRIFNLSSSSHMGHLLYNFLGIRPFKYTKGNKPSTDKEVLDELIEQYKLTQPWMLKLYDFRKLGKLLSTYVDGILDRQIDGTIFASMLQFGTTSGRYSSRNPNLQNQPRIKDDESDLSELVLKYTNAIKKGFIAGKGYKVVNADYASLEPVCFAHMSGDEKLRNVFRNGEDLYSRVGIETFGIVDASANKKDPNYLKNLYPEVRQTSKGIALAIPYGAQAAQIARLTNKTYSEGQEIIDNYLTNFPNLKKYMSRCDYMAKNYGYVKTELGRVRHLKEVRSIYLLFTDRVLESKWAKMNGHTDTRAKYKNMLNNAKNFPIQGLAAHIVNRAMIATMREFKRQGLDAWVALQVHDEITCIAREDQAERAGEVLKVCMEQTTKISVPLSAEPLIADNWAEAK